MSRFYEKLTARNLTFQHVCEVGVYRPETTQLAAFIRRGVRTTLVEANPQAVAQLRQAFAGAHVRIHPVAVWDTPGTLTMARAASSTFATALASSPALVNDRYRLREATTFEVPCVQFSDLDDGTIDLLGIDIEGADWYVLKHLRSRPRVLAIETHGKYYTNPFLSQIKQWLHAHGYVLWYKDRSDSVYIQDGLLVVSLADRYDTTCEEFWIVWRKLMRVFKRR